MTHLKNKIEQQIEDTLKYGITPKTAPYIGELVDILKDLEEIHTKGTTIRSMVGDIMELERQGNTSEEHKELISQLLKDSKLIKDALSEAKLSPEHKVMYLNIFKN